MVYGFLTSLFDVSAFFTYSLQRQCKRSVEERETSIVGCVSKLEALPSVAYPLNKSFPAMLVRHPHLV